MQADRFDKRQILRYVGDFSQLFGIKEYTLTDGKAKGMRALDVRNGSGLEFTVLADRGLDIAGLSFKGINCSYISKTGLVAPEYYEKDGVELLRSFSGVSGGATNRSPLRGFSKVLLVSRGNCQSSSI